ncbi:ATP-binding cassette domain-containing protein [Candidatus Mycobacterium wuenschmannii]|uniref:ATP-binding cassette domain-containing protein n=1 Tax=Candidatus Mycobacterium wuenschmannii TaxID=3027808 RepID=A0ABY8VZ96_9MYCO|nr:FHA domain-containing protein [Candidatus Mycobacterium wuenschmannii]WIM88817.1 ATP-binding cassette domain-containing protein [Candidatus Mycobacterium wuenschmannii]
MSRPAPPVLTVWHNGSETTFAPGHDVIIGRDVRADVRIADPRISRAHLILRFEQGKWIAIDNGSVNGTFVNGYRRPVVDIHDGQSINIGNAGGPQLTFEIGSRRGKGGPPPVGGPPRPAQQTMTWSTPAQPVAPPPPPPPQVRPAPPPRPLPASEYPTTVQGGRPPVGPPPDQATVVNARSAPALPGVPPTEVTMLGAHAAEGANFATRFVKRLAPRATPSSKPTGSVTIGRAADNDIVVPDVLASRYHATLTLTPLGTEIRDTSVNGTFVNGTRVGSAILSEDDVVTVGNIDLVVSGGLLVRRSETEAATQTGGLEVRNVQYTVENGKQLLTDISLTARPGTLTAVIGGSGAGKSTLARLIAGYTTPSGGAVTFEGHDIHAEYASLRSRIGMVPQDDVVHRQLTVNQALSYAAELRLPPDTNKADRAKVVSQVLEELDLTKHADTRVDKLSGGQRKRASVALELLTGPSLLMLDEPTSGLDPALDLQVMTMLRQLADAGRVVLVVTHSLSYLDVCDQVLLMAPGGKMAYCGPPDGIGEVMGTTNWAKIFSQVGADPEEANRRFREREQPQPPEKSDTPADLGEPVHTSVPRQISTIARRQVRLVVADRAYFVFLALLPFILGALSLTVPGSTGFKPATPNGTPDEAAQILALLLPAAAFMGVALTIRDLVSERAIFQREQAVGLSTTAYLLAKTLVFCGFAILQAAIVTAIVVGGKGAPSRGAVLLGHSTVGATGELFLTVAAACVASAVLGLAISSLVRSSEQIMPLFVVAVMAQLVLCGGMVPVTGRLGLDQLSWLMPARWGYAAAASTVDLRHLVPPTLLPQDQFWQHTKHFWLLDMGMLAGLTVFYACFVRWKIRLKR